MYVYALTMPLVIVGRIYAFSQSIAEFVELNAEFVEVRRGISWLNFGIFVCTSSVRPSKALSETL